MVVNQENRAARCVLLAILTVGVSAWVGQVEAQTLHARDWAVELRVEARTSEIVLHWRGDQYARGYTINRKARSAGEWTKIGTAAGHETWFADGTVSRGTGYEYQVAKEGTLQYTGYGYVYAGIELPLVEERGRIILLVESSIAAPLALELNRLEFDLIGDGWQVARREVARTARVTEVKDVIRAVYAEDPVNTRALFLFGNIAVPYSGDIDPDEHPNHRGAWPADVYYADIDGSWTDTLVTSTGAESERNHNVPKDGKFDQNEPPTKLELQVGRVDLSNLTCFANKLPSRNEVDLLRGYLEKDHAFRHGRVPTDARALVFDSIGSSRPEPLSTMAWRNFAPFVGTEIEEMRKAEYFAWVSAKSYLWTAVIAGGSFTSSAGVGSADGFAVETVNAVFGMFAGSYYGDWDTESNFLRAALGSRGRLLVSIYSAQPQWICHTMGLGETIGAAAILTQENDVNGIYVPHNRGAGQVHVALHGDPTLRAHPIASPGQLTGTARDGGVALSWDAVTFPGIAGYLVYEAANPEGPFRRVAAQPVQGSSYFVAGGNLGKQYMVKAVGITMGQSGSYWNSSQGVFFPDRVATSPAGVPTAPRDLVVSGRGEGWISLRWVSGSFDHSGFEVERRAPSTSSFVKIGTVSREQLEFTDNAVTEGGVYAYRVRAVNAAGASGYSNTVTPSTRPGTVEFLGEDRVTQGSWVGRFGSAGYVIPRLEEQLPENMGLTISNANVSVTAFREDVRGVEVPGSDLRSVNAWNHIYPFAFHLNYTDLMIHQVAIYVMSYSGVTDWLDVEVIDSATSRVLDKRRVEEIEGGVHLIYNVSGQVILRVTPPGWWAQGEVYGLFFDDPKVQPVWIEPSGGTFVGKALLRMTTLTSQAEIRYTLDGSEPTQSSPRYAEPFWIYADVELRARAFREGFPPSEIAEVRLKNSVANSFGFIEWDETLGGNWTVGLGSDGYWVAGGRKQLPGYAEVSGLPEPAWLWSEASPEERAPFSDETEQRRVAAAWYSDAELTIDLGIFDTRRRAVSLYFLDWDRQGRVQEVEVIDAAGVVQDRYRVENFVEGKHLVLAVKGYVKLRIKKAQGPNVVLNGIFFDLAPTQVDAGTPLPLTNGRIEGGTLTFTVTGEPDYRFCIDRSENLRDWTCIATNVITRTQIEMRVPMGQGRRGEFLRGHVVN